MKLAIIPALVVALGIMSGCEGRVNTENEADLDRGPEVVGDKTMMADLMRRSQQRGTFDDALALAMQDSAFAAAVVDVVGKDPRFAMALTPQESEKAQIASGKSQSKRSAAPARGKTRTVSTQRASGDALDKTEKTMHKANQKIDQAVRIKRQAEEAKQKIDGIFGRK